MCALSIKLIWLLNLINWPLLKTPDFGQDAVTIISHQKYESLGTDYGSWVLITGASSGIDREIAIRFGEAGFNVVITERREKNLNELSTYLFDEFQIEAVPIAGVLSKRQDLQQLMEETAHLLIKVAVLNAGFGTSGQFIDSDLEQEINMLELNCRALLILTHHFANKLLVYNLRMTPRWAKIKIMGNVMAGFTKHQS